VDYEQVDFETDDETLSALAQTGEREVETTLRPRKLAEFVGQPRVREQLELVLESARRRGVPPDHVLLSGPPGLGKTSMAMIIAATVSSTVAGKRSAISLVTAWCWKIESPIWPVTKRPRYWTNCT